MSVGFIGTGKLGLPVAISIAQKGHRVFAFEANPETVAKYESGVTGLYEPGIDEALASVKGRLQFVSLEKVVESSKIIFVAVQTPHAPELDGSIRFNHVRKDFDYTFLEKALSDIATLCQTAADRKVVAVISTVSPGTVRRIQAGLPQGNYDLVYNPFFIAMGTTQKDYLDPEFVLIGERKRGEAGHYLADFYSTIHEKPILRMAWEEAECVKMGYNGAVGCKVVLANTITQLCHGVGADADVVMGTLCKATDRIISPKYLKGGMGDGGGCHPRDNLVLSALSDRLGLRHNLFDYLMDAREKHLEWLCDMIDAKSVVMMGRTYKVGTNLTGGSCSVLMANILKEHGVTVRFHDPVTDPEIPERAECYVIGTPWPQFREFPFPEGCTILDPWRFLPEVPGCNLISVGRR